jgi:glycosyltransferase 2 family protein
MNSKLLSFLKYFLLLAVALGLLAFAFRGVSVGKIIHDMLQANIFWVLLSALFSVVAFISRAYRWNLLIESVGYSPPLKKTTYALMVGYFANLAFPRLGEVTRCGSLSKAESIPFSPLLGTVIVERVIDVISLVICLLLTAILEYKRLGSFLSDNIIDPVIGKFRQLMASPPLIIAAIVVILGLAIAIFYFIKRSRQKGKESKIVHVFKNFMNGLRSVSTLRRPWLFVFHSVFIWFLYFMSTYACLFALPSTSHLGFNAALFLLVAGGLGMSAPVQGGIGAYHLLVSQGLMLYGLSQQDGLTFATLIHSLSLVLVVLFGIASLLLLFSGNKKNTISRK